MHIRCLFSRKSGYLDHLIEPVDFSPVRMEHHAVFGRMSLFPGVTGNGTRGSNWLHGPRTRRRSFRYTQFPERHVRLSGTRTWL